MAKKIIQDKENQKLARIAKALKKQLSTIESKIKQRNIN